jgi:hypothetical protein
MDGSGLVVVKKVRPDWRHMIRGSGPMISDSFGRIFIVLPDKRTLKGRFNRIGYGSAEVSHRCSVFNDNSPEVRLTLPKK